MRAFGSLQDERWSDGVPAESCKSSRSAFRKTTVPVEALSSVVNAGRKSLFDSSDIGEQNVTTVEASIIADTMRSRERTIESGARNDTC